MRNTPTSVGKTFFNHPQQAHIRKHPHERGEDEERGRRLKGREETPPRAWGRRRGGTLMAGYDGNTPTSVGKTWKRPLTGSTTWKHPHERGEDPASICACLRSSETPPRAWGRLETGIAQGFLAGNTPTSVGKTGKANMRPLAKKKHPHERGEDVTPPPTPRASLETPPRAWGRPPLPWAFTSLGRNTPTSVGKT